MQAAFDSYGARLGVDGPGDVLDAVRRATRGFASEMEPGPVDRRFEFAVTAEGFELRTPGDEPQHCADADDAVEKLLDLIHVTVSRTARRALFVHAAVVAWGDEVVVVPGRSHTGKSTFAAEAVRQGATYFSDEFAVLDRDGLVHPYARSLCLRTPDGARRHVPVEALPGVAATEPARPTVVLSTWFEPECRWNPRSLAGSRAALLLIDNTVLARKEHREALRLGSHLATSTTTFVGPRGEAAETVTRLRRQLEVVDSGMAR